MSRHISAAAVLPQNAEQLGCAVLKALQVQYKAHVRRLVTNLRRWLVAVINARGGPIRLNDKITMSALLFHKL